MKKSNDSKVLDVILKSSWAILPETLQTIHDLVLNHGDSLSAMSEPFEKRGTKEQHLALRKWSRIEGSDSALVSDGVAYIPMVGVLAKRMNLFMEISGGTSTQLLQRDIEMALESKEVNSIFLDVDSPGGTVDGTMALSDLIYEARGGKPIVAFSNGQMCSAAFWIGSAASKIVATPDSILGSIGVLSMHYDYSKADEKEGVKRTIIKAGKYKAIGNDTEPLSHDARKVIQDELDYFYGLFVDGVARNRGTSSETVLTDMADGRVFIGKQALDIGMVDEIGSFETAFKLAQAEETGASKTAIGGKKEMGYSRLRQEDPEGYAILQDEVKKAMRNDAPSSARGKSMVTVLPSKRTLRDQDAEDEALADHLASLVGSGPRKPAPVFLDQESEDPSPENLNDEAIASELYALAMDGRPAKPMGSTNLDVADQSMDDRPDENALVDELFAYTQKNRARTVTTGTRQSRTADADAAVDPGPALGDDETGDETLAEELFQMTQGGGQ